MSILAWFRGLFGKPTKKRQVIDNEHIYTAPKYRRYDALPQPGKLNELEARFILTKFATSTPSQVARKLNKMGYLTPRGRKWTQFTAYYWRLTDTERLLRVQKSLEHYQKNKRVKSYKKADVTLQKGLQTAVYNWPKAGQISARTARKVATDLSKMGLTSPAIAAVMNHHGLLTPKGSKWTAERAQYWSQADETLQKRRQYWRDRDKTRRQQQTVIFRNADLRPRQNGIN